MNRPERYVTVTMREWVQYNRAAPRSVARRLLHLAIFYSGRPLREGGFCLGPYSKDGYRVRDVLHPLVDGRIPRGHAVTEKHYQNETRWVVRSERETDHTRSNATERAL